MYHPVMTIRPDGIIRSGIIQPFGVRTMDPVQFARREIDPFITAIRPEAAQYMDNGNGSLGIVASEVVPGAFGAASVQNMPRFWHHGFGQTLPSDALFKDGRVLGAIAGALTVGAIAGFLVGRAMKRRKR